MCDLGVSSTFYPNRFWTELSNVIIWSHNSIPQNNFLKKCIAVNVVRRNVLCLVSDYTKLLPVGASVINREFLQTTLSKVIQDSAREAL